MGRNSKNFNRKDKKKGKNYLTPIKNIKNSSFLKKVLFEMNKTQMLLKEEKFKKKFLSNLKGYYLIRRNIFNEHYYLENNLDVAKSTLDPLLHYLLYGFYEGRKPSYNFNSGYHLVKFRNKGKTGLNSLIKYILDVKKDNKKYKEKTKQKTFEEFLTESYNSPLIYSEDFNQYKSCFNEMKNISSDLIKIAENLKDPPLVSVIMPVYNRENVVENSVNSVLNQSYPNIELIIVDDGSIDGTLDVLQGIKDERIILVKNKENQGQTKSRNIAIKASKGEYITYLDSDDDWDKDYILAMMGAFLKLKDADLIYSGQKMFENRNLFAVRFASFNKSLLRNQNYIGINTLLHSSKIFKEIGTFDETLKRCEDWELLERISTKFKIYSVPILLSNCYEDHAKNRVSLRSNISYCEKVREINLKRFKSSIENKPIFQLNKNVSIIILSCGSVEKLKKTINSVFKLKLDEWISTIVILRKSDKDNPLLKKITNDEKIKLINTNNEEDKSNFLIEKDIFDSNSDIVVLRDNVILTNETIGLMQKYSYNLKNCGLLIPQQIIPGKSGLVEKLSYYANPNYEYDMTPLLNQNNIINMDKFHSGKVLELNQGILSCFYIKEDVFSKINKMKIELNQLNDFNKEFFDSIQKIGLKIYNVSDAVVYCEF
ncbi:MAG: glycosyltransferase [Methanobacteriaceae archaeon]|nr:glycosyltransferase [Candidatus Methanorudis spinitermitis]